MFVNLLNELFLTKWGQPLSVKVGTRRSICSLTENAKYDSRKHNNKTVMIIKVNTLHILYCFDMILYIYIYTSCDTFTLQPCRQVVEILCNNLNEDLKCKLICMCIHYGIRWAGVMLYIIHIISYTCWYVIEVKNFKHLISSNHMLTCVRSHTKILMGRGERGQLVGIEPEGGMVGPFSFEIFLLFCPKKKHVLCKI